MTLPEQLEKSTIEIVKSLFDVTLEKVDISLTRKDQQGDYTVMVFPMLRQIKGNPAVIGKQIGERLRTDSELVSDIEVIKGFLNLTLSYKAFLQDFNTILLDNYFIKVLANRKSIHNYFNKIQNLKNDQGFTYVDDL